MVNTFYKHKTWFEIFKYLKLIEKVSIYSTVQKS